MITLSESTGPPFDDTHIDLWTILNEADHKFADELALAVIHQPHDLYPEISKLAPDPNRQYVRWTFSQLRHAADLFSAALLARGVRPGMPIATFLLNGVEIEIAWRAAIQLNCPIVPLSPAVISDNVKVKHYLETSGARLLVLGEFSQVPGIEHAAKDLVDSMLLKISAGSTPSQVPEGWVSFSKLLQESSQSWNEEAHTSTIAGIARDENSLVYIPFTSGSTALPKACSITNKIWSMRIRADTTMRCMDTTSSAMAALPMFFAAGVSTATSAAISGCALVVPSPSPNPAAIVEAFKLERITHGVVVPALIGIMMQHPDFEKADFSHLDHMACGGATALPSHFKRIYDVFKVNKAVNVLASTEAGILSMPQIDQIPPWSLNVSFGNVPAPGSRIKLCIPDSRELVLRGTPGEMHYSSPGTIKSYIGREDQAFYQDEKGIQWYVTGDIGVMEPNGDLYLSGRFKDMIIRGGSNVSPSAIETVLERITDAEVQVIGVPSEVAGEVAVAVMKVKIGETVVTSGLREKVVAELGPSYAPEAILSLSDLSLNDWPRTDNGKIRKATLRELVLKHYENQEIQLSTAPADSELLLLTSLWQSVLGVQDLNADRSILELADSLTCLRFVGLLQKQTGKKLSLLEIQANPTIASQTRLLATKRGNNDLQMLSLDLSRRGPPTAKDMIHTHGSVEVATDTEKICTQALVSAGFSWEDVEDVFPVPGLMHQIAHSRRPEGWNNRIPFETQTLSVQQLDDAIQSVLALHPMPRTLVASRGTQKLYVTLRITPDIQSRLVRVLEDKCRDAHDLEARVMADKELNHLSLPGPLFRVVIAPTYHNTAAMVMMFHHSIGDAFYFMQFVEDLKSNMQTPAVEPNIHVPYKFWAENLYNQRGSELAQQAVDYHVGRLRGLKAKSKSLFPVQRNADWLRRQSTVQPGSASEEANGQHGILKRKEIPNLSRLLEDETVQPSALVKCALALVNVSRTRQQHALFAQPMSGRNLWPFLPEFFTRNLPLPSEVSGPTLEMVINCIEIPTTESVLSFIKRVQEEQEELALNCHADFNLIVDRLNELNGRQQAPGKIPNGVNGTNGVHEASANGHNSPDEYSDKVETDGDVMLSIWRRQLFNWVPSPEPTSKVEKEELVMAGPDTNTDDNGLLWNCHIEWRDADELKNGAGAEGSGRKHERKAELVVRVMWDEKHLTAADVDGLSTQLVDCAAVLAESSSWGKPVSEVWSI